MLSGKLVSLRAVEKEDYEQIREWLSDPELLYLLGARPIPVGNVEPEKLPDLFRLRDGRVLSVLNQDKSLVGIVAFGNFHEFNRTAQLMVLLGDRGEWGRGYGSDALRSIVRFAFEDLNLNCIEAHIPEFNQRALHVFEKVGFKVEGQLRSRLFLRGQYWNTSVVSALRDGWTGQTAETAARPADLGAPAQPPAPPVPAQPPQPAPPEPALESPFARPIGDGAV